MPIARNLDSLPSASTSTQGWAPDAEPRFGQVLAEQWFSEDNTRERAHPDARFRHSDAGACSRAVAYAALGVPQSDPIDLPGVFVARLGTMIHDAWQEVLPKRYPGATVEVKVHEGELAGHVDAVVWGQGAGIGREAGWTVAIEGKSVGGYKYQLAVGMKGEPQGPSHAHVIQAALNGLRVEADEVVICYWARDAISRQQAERKKLDDLRRVVAEWTLDRATYEPIARKEIERIEAILALVDEGTLPKRTIPDPGLPAGHVIVDPRKGSWVVRASLTDTIIDAGSTWQCHYCNYQQVCSLTPSERSPIVTVDEAVTTLGLPARPGRQSPGEA